MTLVVGPPYPRSLHSQSQPATGGVAVASAVEGYPPVGGPT